MNKYIVMVIPINKKSNANRDADKVDKRNIV